MDKHELQYLSWLTSVNTALGRYIARVMDEATGHDTTTYSVSTAETESELGEALMQLGRALVAAGAGQPPAITGGPSLELPPGRTEGDGSS